MTEALREHNRRSDLLNEMIRLRQFDVHQCYRMFHGTAHVLGATSW
jgi:hypothetical protein